MSTAEMSTISDVTTPNGADLCARPALRVVGPIARPRPATGRVSFDGRSVRVTAWTPEEWAARTDDRPRGSVLVREGVCVIEFSRCDPGDGASSG